MRTLPPLYCIPRHYPDLMTRRSAMKTPHSTNRHADRMAVADRVLCLTWPGSLGGEDRVPEQRVSISPGRWHRSTTLGSLAVSYYCSLLVHLALQLTPHHLHLKPHASRPPGGGDAALACTHTRLSPLPQIPYVPSLDTRAARPPNLAPP